MRIFLISVRAAVAVAVLSAMQAVAETITCAKSGDITIYWDDPETWDLGRVPQEGDKVEIPSSWAGYNYCRIVLTNSTPVLESLFVGRRRRLEVRGWDTCIKAGSVRLEGAAGKTPGEATCGSVYAPSSTATSSNRVWIVADSLVVTGAGFIQALGYTAKLGPGWEEDGYSASHGGYSARKEGLIYGSITEPVDLGSGGAKYGGGGAIRLDVGELVVNGFISATYNGGYSENEGSRGSGGSIWITCDTISGSGGIHANGGGHYFTAYPEKTGVGCGGGGGRISVEYDAEKQKSVACNVSFSARGGTDWGGTANRRHESIGRCGTLYFTDDLFLKRPGMMLAGVVYYGADVTRLTAGAFTGYLADNHSLTNCCFEFDDAEFSHSGDLSFSGGLETRANGLRFTGCRPEVSIGGSLSLDHACLRFDNGGELSVTGDLTLAEADYPAQSAEIFVVAAPTNGTSDAYGATVDVGGTWTIGSKSSFIPVCSPTNGSIVAATAKNFVLRSGGEINADGRGWGAMLGPGSSRHYLASASYGGKGGVGNSIAVGNVPDVYGNEKLPLDPGSGSRDSKSVTGARGGGVVYLTVAGRLTLDGAVSACGKDGGAWTAASSGGSVLIKTHKLCPSAGSISATGGVPAVSDRGGCGGGGRVAVYCTIDATDEAFHANVTAKGGYYDGAADYYQGGDGTVYWKILRGFSLILR